VVRQHDREAAGGPRRGNNVLTLRVLTETHPENGRHLNREVVTAVNAVCRSKHDWIALGLPLLEAWDNLDLGELYREAIEFGLWRAGHPIWETLATMLLIRLEPMMPVRERARGLCRAKATRTHPRMNTFGTGDMFAEHRFRDRKVR
jgi:hypothetical protein